MELKDAIEWGNQPRTLAWQPLDCGHVLACPKYPVVKLLHLLPEKYITSLTNNEKIKPCCRDISNLSIEAWYSKETEKLPDIYKIYCSECDCCHVRFCVGGDHPKDLNKKDYRPFWEVR